MTFCAEIVSGTGPITLMDHPVEKKECSVTGFMCRLVYQLFLILQDELLPPSQMRDLRHAVANPKTCTWVEFPYAGHMDAYELARTEYWPALGHFFNEHGLGVSGAFRNREIINDDVMEQVGADACY